MIQWDGSALRLDLILKKTQLEDEALKLNTQKPAIKRLLKPAIKSVDSVKTSSQGEAILFGPHSYSQTSSKLRNRKLSLYETLPFCPSPPLGARGKMAKLRKVTFLFKTFWQVKDHRTDIFAIVGGLCRYVDAVLTRLVLTHCLSIVWPMLRPKESKTFEVG